VFVVVELSLTADIDVFDGIVVVVVVVVVVIVVDVLVIGLV